MPRKFELGTTPLWNTTLVNIDCVFWRHYSLPLVLTQRP